MPRSKSYNNLLIVALLLQSLCFLVDCQEEDAGRKKDEDTEDTDVTFPTPEEPACDLCADGANGLKWPYAYINEYGATCAQRLLDIYAKYEPDSHQCKWQVIQFRNRCCTGETEPKEIEQATTDSPGDYQGSGGENTCELCHNGRFPGSTSMVINMLDIDMGAAPCDDYYYIGQDGLIPDHLCEPIQHFAFGPCGCEDGIVVGNAGDELDEPRVNDSVSPSKAPVSRNPTASPTFAPTTTSPTEKPTTSSPRTAEPSSSSSPSGTTPVSDAPTTSLPTAPATIAPTIEYNQIRLPLDEGKDAIAKMGGDNRGGAGGFRRRLLKGR